MARPQRKIPDGIKALDLDARAEQFALDKLKETNEHYPLESDYESSLAHYTAAIRYGNLQSYYIQLYKDQEHKESEKLKAMLKPKAKAKAKPQRVVQMKREWQNSYN